MRVWPAFLGVFLAMFCGAAQAQDLLDRGIDGAVLNDFWEIDCDAPPHHSHPLPYNVVATRTYFSSQTHDRDQPKLLNAEFATRLIEHIQHEAERVCVNRFNLGLLKSKPVHYQIRFGSLDTPEVEALYNADDKTWQITNRYRDGVLAKQAAIDAAAKARQDGIASRKIARDAFADQYKIELYAPYGDLAANPYQFKDRIIAFRTNFVRMLSESEALVSGSTQMLVTGVPTTTFHHAGPVVLAVKVTGTRTVKTANGGDGVFPVAQFVGVHICGTDCWDFLEKQ